MLTVKDVTAPVYSLSQGCIIKCPYLLMHWDSNFSFPYLKLTFFLVKKEYTYTLRIMVIKYLSVIVD